MRARALSLLQSLALASNHHVEGEHVAFGVRCRIRASCCLPTNHVALRLRSACYVLHPISGQGEADVVVRHLDIQRSIVLLGPRAVTPLRLLPLYTVTDATLHLYFIAL